MLPFCPMPGPVHLTTLLYCFSLQQNLIPLQLLPYPWGLFLTVCKSLTNFLYGSRQQLMTVAGGNVFTGGNVPFKEVAVTLRAYN